MNGRVWLKKWESLAENKPKSGMVLGFEIKLLIMCMKELLSAIEFAAYSGLSANKVYALMKSGGIETKEVRNGLRITHKIYSSELKKFKKTTLFNENE